MYFWCGLNLITNGCGLYFGYSWLLFGFFVNSVTRFFQDYLDFPWIIGLPRITQKVLRDYKPVAGPSNYGALYVLFLRL